MADKKYTPPTYPGPPLPPIPSQMQNQYYPPPLPPIPSQMQNQYYPPPVVSQPSSTTVVINPMMSQNFVKPRMWSSGLFSCMEDFGSCCMVFWCSSCFSGVGCAGPKMLNEMGENGCLPCVYSGWLVTTRTKLRTQLNIQGSMCDDWCVVCFCTQCAHCQVWREFKTARANGEL